MSWWLGLASLISEHSYACTFTPRHFFTHRKTQKFVILESTEAHDWLNISLWTSLPSLPGNHAMGSYTQIFGKLTPSPHTPAGSTGSAHDREIPVITLWSDRAVSIIYCIRSTTGKNCVDEMCPPPITNPRSVSHHLMEGMRIRPYIF